MWYIIKSKKDGKAAEVQSFLLSFYEKRMKGVGRMKTAICGYSGSGKSTLARRIGEIEQVPVLYLDTVQFVENWQERNRDEARSIVKSFMEQENWVIDGNYTNFFYQERMEAADRILILVFNRFTCLYRAFKRYFRYRNQTRESMAEGCKEKIDLEFVLWILKNGRTRKKQEKLKELKRCYPEKVTILKNQRQLDRYYQTLSERTEGK